MNTRIFISLVILFCDANRSAAGDSSDQEFYPGQRPILHRRSTKARAFAARQAFDLFSARNYNVGHEDSNR